MSSVERRMRGIVAEELRIWRSCRPFKICRNPNYVEGAYSALCTVAHRLQVLKLNDQYIQKRDAAR